MFKVFDAACRIEVSVFPPSDQLWWQISGGEYVPAVLDVGGSMEDDGAQVTFVARRTGTHRVRVRGTTSNDCQTYEMTVVRGATDVDQPLPIH